MQSVRVGRVTELAAGASRVPVAMPTRLFGTLRGTVVLPVHAEDGAARVTWARTCGCRGCAPASRCAASC